jgi:hypothetical protein
MKLFSVVLFLFVSTAFAKNKVMYETCVNCPVKEKEIPLYDLSLQTDFKSANVVTLESRVEEIVQFGSGEDFVAYIKRENKVFVLYMITDFKTFAKRRVAERVQKFTIRNGVLFFEVFEPTGDRSVNVLYSISDFKSGAKSEVRRGYGRFAVDEY